MKKIWKRILIIIWCLILLILIVDIIRVAWCQTPWFKIKTSCEYDNNHSTYKEIGLWYEYIEDSYDEGIGWIVGKIFWIKACDIPAWNLTSCNNNEEEINPTINEIEVYTWTFHADYIDDDYQYLWDILITWDTHWKLRGYKWDTWYIYNYTFDAWWNMNDMFYQTISVTFTSPNSINWESDLMTWYAEWDNVPYFWAPLIKLFAFDRWVQILGGDTRPLFWIRCFSDPLSDSRFREWLVPAYSSWITELTTISNKSVEVPFINHDSTVQFTYGHSTPYLWDFMDQCILELSHTQNNDIQLPFKLSWWFWDSASIIWWNNKQSDSYCKHRDIEIEITNWMKCYIESDNDTNVTEVKLWDISDIQ